MIGILGYNAGMSPIDGSLAWIDSQQGRMLKLVTEWCQINSYSRNLAGLAEMAARLQLDFECLGGVTELIDLPGEVIVDNTGAVIASPLGRALRIRKRAEAPTRVFLGIHMDTVYAPSHPLQRVVAIERDRLNGPGVADAKGGLCVMLLALQALERTAPANDLGWEVLINPDEELGSPGSAGLLREAAARNQLGLIFEPALADGTMVGERKGSGNFDVVIRGRSAHAGRDFHHGRSAMNAAAELVLALEQIHRACPGVTVNVGRIDGGGPTNIVPDLAIVRFNVRLPAALMPEHAMVEIEKAIDQVSRRDGIGLKLHGGFSSPPRPMDLNTTAWYEHVRACGQDLGFSLNWIASGGVSDANKLAAAGLPVIDSLGPSGGALHSRDEFMLPTTLTTKAKLTFLLLCRLADGLLA